MAQFLRPDSLVSAGSWTGNHTALDEAIPSDLDIAYSQDNPNGSIFEVGLSDPAQTPGAGAVTVRYRFAQVRSGVLNGTGTATSLDVSVMQGANVIAADAMQSPGGLFVTRTWQPDLSGVTDWSDVRLRFVATGGGGSPSNRRGVAVSWAEIETPDGAVAITGSMAATETGADTFAASGAVTEPGITGTLAATEAGADAFAGSGSVAWPAVTGDLAAVEAGSDAFTGSGSVDWVPVTGAMAAAEAGSDVFTGSGGAIVSGALSATETGSDAFAASGSVAWPTITGVLASTEALQDIFAGSGSVAAQGVTGALAAAETGQDSFAGGGSVAWAVINGLLVAIEGGLDTMQGAGSVASPAITGAMSAIETGSDIFSGGNTGAYYGRDGLPDIRMRLAMLEDAARAAGWAI